MSKSQRQDPRRKGWGFARCMPADEGCEQAIIRKTDCFLVAMGWVPAQTIGHITDTVSVSLFYNKLFPIEQILSMPAWYDFRQDLFNEGAKCHMKILYSTCYKLRMQNRDLFHFPQHHQMLFNYSIWSIRQIMERKWKHATGSAERDDRRGESLSFYHNNFVKMWKTSVNVPWNLCERSKLS